MKNLKTFLPYILKYRREFLIGIVALILTDSITLGVPWLIKDFIDTLPLKPTSDQLLKYVFLLILLAVTLMVGRYGWRKFMFGPSRKIEFDILNSLFIHLLNLDRLWYQKQKTGDLMSRATNDLRAVREFFGLGVLILIDAIFLIIMAVSMMSWINFELALKVFIPLPFISILFFSFVKEIGKRHKTVQEHLAKITEQVQENLSGIRVLHAFVQEENEKKKFMKLNQEYIQKNLQVTRVFGIFTPTMVFAIGVAAMISLWMGGKAVIAEEITLGAFVAFNGYLMLLSWPMMGIGYVFNLTQKGISAMERVNELFLARPEIVASISDGNYFPTRGNLEFSDIRFTYPDEPRESLKGINLKIPRGQTLGIVGMIGAGKTTLANMLLRFYDPDSGVISIDGKSIREVPLKSLRDYIGYVSQEPFLFSMSIRNNISLGREKVSDSEMDKIVQLSGLDSDMDQFPDRLDTEIGEKGVSLSGGQKQRIALARALLKKPQLLILDDAFSNLDTETENRLLCNLTDSFREVTKIIISHRLSTIREANSIIVLAEGAIAEQGSHSQLVEASGIYASLFQRQELAKEMEIVL